MNFATLKSLTLPQGKAVKITQGSTVLWQAQEQSEPIINLIDTVGVEAGKRLSSSGGTKDNAATFVTGAIRVQQGYIIRTSGANFINDGNAGVWCYRSDGSFWTMSYLYQTSSPVSVAAWDITFDSSGNLVITIKNDSVASIRLCGIGTGAGLMVTKNQEIA